MTYFAFLAVFVGIPIAILTAITIIDYRRDKWLPDALHAWRPWVVLLSLCVVALIYTTPWDNYLVATRVWWYDPELVTGIVLGWVPIEEYTFFLLQPIMTGLFVLLLMRYVPLNPTPSNHPRIRFVATGATAVIWLVSTVLLVLSLIDPAYKPFTYLGLELSWALIPVIIQMAFGADILWRHRGVVLPGILIPTIYLSLADTIAIGGGTWTIDPAQSLNLLLGGILPIEELVFFLLTNTLVTLGLTLVLAEESQVRAMALQQIGFLRTLLKRVQRTEVNQDAV